MKRACGLLLLACHLLSHAAVKLDAIAPQLERAGAEPRVHAPLERGRVLRSGGEANASQTEWHRKTIACAGAARDPCAQRREAGAPDADVHDELALLYAARGDAALADEHRKKAQALRETRR